jgi:transcriptional regulator with XRE-family HTH domain
MASEVTTGNANNPELRTLADKVSWLVEHAHPAGRGPFSIGEVCFLIHTVTGEQISHTTIWKLRNGQQKNPQMRVIDALARTFGVEAGFLVDDDYDQAKVRPMQEQAELIALVRGADITAGEFRSLFGLDGKPTAGELIVVELPGSGIYGGSRWWLRCDGVDACGGVVARRHRFRD